VDRTQQGGSLNGVSDKNFLRQDTGRAGCGATIGVRLALKVLGENTVAISATGCLEVFQLLILKLQGNSMDARSVWKSAAVASAWAALNPREKNRYYSCCIGGDGGTADIGLQALSGAMESGTYLIYICYDNNNWIRLQKVGHTIRCINNNLTPCKESFGEEKPKKEYANDNGSPWSSLRCNGLNIIPWRLMKKVKKAAEVEGPAYIHLQPAMYNLDGVQSRQNHRTWKASVETGHGYSTR